MYCLSCRPEGRRLGPTRAPPGSSIAPSCPRVVRRAPSGPGSHPHGQLGGAGPTRRIHHAGPAVPRRRPGRPEGRRPPGTDTTPPPQCGDVTRRPAAAARPSRSTPRRAVWKCAGAAAVRHAGLQPTQAKRILSDVAALLQSPRRPQRHLPEQQTAAPSDRSWPGKDRSHEENTDPSSAVL